MGNGARDGGGAGRPRGDALGARGGRRRNPSTSATRTGASCSGVGLDPAIRATGDLSEAVQADLLLLVTPAQNLAAIAAELLTGRG